MDEHILSAYDFKDGKGVLLSGDSIAEQTRSTESFSWVHLDASHPDTKTWLEREAPFLDSFSVQALLADETRPRMIQVGDGALMILRGVNLNENSTPEDMVSVRLWVDRDRVITLRRRKVKPLEDIEKKIIAGEKVNGAGHLVGMLVSRMFERMEPVLSELDESVDNVEEQILENASISLREKIIQVRKQAIIFRRYMAPQRDALDQLRMADFDWLSDFDKRHLQENYNHVTRYVEDLDTIRERAQIIKDELANIMSDRLNKNMYVLSVIAAIFLPLGFLTGLLGINIGGIPGAEYSSAFWIFCTMLCAIVAAQVVIFRKLDWF